MKLFLKIFTIAFTSFVMLFSGVFISFNTFMRDNHPNADVPPIREEEDEHFQQGDLEDMDELLRAAMASNRVNIILLGLDGPRSDSMMLVSFDLDNKDLDIIAIPRDTYYPRAGYTRVGQKKINAAYGAHGAAGVKTIVSDLLLDIPVHHYVTVTYTGAAAIVDSIGGVPIYIPQRMKYDDPFDDPPLHIDFAAGDHLLNGVDSVKFLRYRQPNPGSGAMNRDGDLGRIRAQQEFIQSALQRALSFGNLPGLASTSFRFVRTDMDLQDVIRYATNATGLKMDNVNMHMLPGVDRYEGGISYYFHDAAKTRQLLLDIYGVEEEIEDEKEEN